MSWLDYCNSLYPKHYYANEFRGSVPSSLSFTGDVARHKFDCQLAAAAASYSPGPRYSDTTINQYARNLSSNDNFYYYGSASSNYGHDRSSVQKVLASVQTSERVVLSSYESSHVRAGAA
jgi:hypothetical protein